MDNAPAPSPASVPLPAADLPAVGDLLTAGTSAALDNAGVLFGVWCVCQLPAQALGFAVRLSAGLNDSSSFKAALEAQNYGALIPLAVVGVVGLVLGLLGYAATILLAAKALRGQPVALGDLLMESVGRMFAVAAASLLTGLCVGFGLILLIIPGLYLGMRLSLAVCGTCVEGLGPVDALGRGWKLTAGRFWDVAVFMLAVFAVSLVAAVAAGLGGVLLRVVGAAAGAAGTALAGLVANLAQFMISAWGAACMTKFYLELSARTPAQNR